MLFSSYNLEVIPPFVKNSKGNKESSKYIFGYVLLILLQYNSGGDEILQSAAVGARQCKPNLARIFHELLSRDHEDGRATWQPQGVGSEAYLNGTSQGPTPEDARKDGYIRGRSK
jgi:hypothetical protein